MEEESQQHQQHQQQVLQEHESLGSSATTSSPSTTKQECVPPLSSCWSTAATTPMTSRPHFRHEAFPPSPLHARRQRSHSLGSGLEARHRQQQQQQQQQQQLAFTPLKEYPVHFDDWRDYLLLPIDTSTPLRGKRRGHVGTDKDEFQKLMLADDTARDASSKTDVLGSNDGFHVLQKEDEHNLQSDTTEKQSSISEKENSVWICIMYGLINATIVLPVLISFASIIYRDEAFASAMPTLVKLTLVSGMVHQVCFSTFSSLPFAVGQVQDAGLIFLSSMTTSIVEYCRIRHYDLQTVLATATICIPLATAFLGVGLILVGRWHLAQYVQLLPTCVVGGYLAYIGWFCGMAGIGLMAGRASEVAVSVV